MTHLAALYDAREDEFGAKYCLKLGHDVTDKWVTFLSDANVM